MTFDWIWEIDALICQEELTRRLGQVECPGSIVDPEMHGSWMATVFDSCPGCGAQV